MTLPIYLFALLFCPDLVHSQGQISFAPGSTEIEILAHSTLLDPFFVHETLGTHTDYDARGGLHLCALRLVICDNLDM